MRMNAFSVPRIVIMSFPCLLCSLALLSCAYEFSQIKGLDAQAQNYELAGRKQTLSGHYEDAVKSYTEAISLAGSAQNQCIYMGWLNDCDAEKGRYYFRRLLSDLHAERAYVYIMMGEDDSAVDDLKYALKYNKDNEYARHNLDFIKQRDSGMVTKAEDTNRAADYVKKGMKYYDNKQYDSSIAEYTKAIKVDINYAIAYYNRGLAYSGKKMYENSIRDFSKYIEFTAGKANIYVYYNRGQAYEESGRIKEAIDDYTVFAQNARAEGDIQNVEWIKGKIEELSKGSKADINNTMRRLRDE